MYIGNRLTIHALFFFFFFFFGIGALVDLGAGSLAHEFQPQARNGLGLKSKLDS
jgi:hypothetical protein